jgi:hypothetical protein
MRKPYRPRTPPLALRLAAVALAFATMGLLVVLPAELETVHMVAPDDMHQAAAASTRSVR